MFVFPGISFQATYMTTENKVTSDLYICYHILITAESGVVNYPHFVFIFLF